MNQESHCYKCRTKLAQAESPLTLATLAKACQVTPETLTFSVVCPKCGADNHVKIKY